MQTNPPKKNMLPQAGDSEKGHACSCKVTHLLSSNKNYKVTAEMCGLAWLLQCCNTNSNIYERQRLGFKLGHIIIIHSTAVERKLLPLFARIYGGGQWKTVYLFTIYSARPLWLQTVMCLRTVQLFHSQPCRVKAGGPCRIPQVGKFMRLPLLIQARGLISHPYFAGRLLMSSTGLPTDLAYLWVHPGCPADQLLVHTDQATYACLTLNSAGARVAICQQSWAVATPSINPSTLAPMLGYCSAPSTWS